MLLFFYLWMRWTLPRYRYDQLMQFGWKFLLPLAVVNLLVTAAGVLYFGALTPSSSTCSARSPSVASLLVIGQRNPIYSVLLLIASFGALSGLYILLDSPFAAVTQIIVYAGAIMVLFLFVVMLLNVPREDAAEWDRSHPLNRPGARRLGGALAVLLLRGTGLGRLARRARGRRCGVKDVAGGHGQLGRGHRPVDLHRLRVPVRSDVDPDSRGDGGRRRSWRDGSRSSA